MHMDSSTDPFAWRPEERWVDRRLIVNSNNTRPLVLRQTIFNFVHLIVHIVNLLFPTHNPYYISGRGIPPLLLLSFPPFCSPWFKGLRTEGFVCHTGRWANLFYLVMWINFTWHSLTYIDILCVGLPSWLPIYWKPFGAFHQPILL